METSAVRAALPRQLRQGYPGEALGWPRAIPRGRLWVEQLTIVLVLAWMGLGASVALAETAPDGRAASPGIAQALAAFHTEASPCSAEVRAAGRCVPLALHVAVDSTGALVQSPAWWSMHLAQAHRHFGPLGVEFEVVSVGVLPRRFERIASRGDRDELGHHRARRGRVDVFVVGPLENVDEPGVIRGVHWRDRGRRGSRWVILSQIAKPMVLAHELGHYFGLPHSTYPSSIMNKSGGERPPSETWTFVPEERAVLRRNLHRQRKEF